jgi:hypothetical protein
VSNLLNNQKNINIVKIQTAKDSKYFKGPDKQFPIPSENTNTKVTSYLNKHIEITKKDKVLPSV